MLSIDWSALFEESDPRPGATTDEIESFVATWSAPLTDTEIADILGQQRNPFPPSDPLFGNYRPFDPRLWRLPRSPLPASYVHFLRWSNGGEFTRGDRYFQMLSTGDLRAILFAYEVPQYMPLAIPFAFDGGGCFYLFDMRHPAVSGEYPILFAGCGALFYDDAIEVGRSLFDVCSESTHPRER